MWRWNAVNDYRILFTHSGRYQRWSERKRVLMLAKAVNKMKPSVLYDEKEIKKIRNEEWRLQLKENILSLNYWKRKEQEPLLYVSDPEEIDSEVLQQFDVNTESMNMADICTQSQALVCPVEKINSMPPNGQERSPSVLTSQSDDNNALIDDMQEEHLIDEESDESCNTVLLNETALNVTIPNITEPVETLQSEEVAPEIANIYAVNTASMIDSQFSAQSSLPISMPLIQSQDVIPNSYDNFKNIIPLTSTQSQSHESEEMHTGGLN